MAQNPVKPPAAPSAEGLAAAATQAARKGPPPVHLWNPAFCGDLDIEIRRDGLWFYLGTPIGREPLVRLFASILKLEDGKYYLVTPVEKVGIRVQDVPFIAVDAEAVGNGVTRTLTFTTNVDDELIAGAEHPLRVEVDAETGEPAPYLHVRVNLEALIHRNVFYQLVDMAVIEQQDGREWLGVWSSGQFFPIGLSAE